jgi:FMN-dependent NADH-azoreductase
MESALDHQEAYLRAFLGFLGISDATIVRAEGMQMGPELREQGFRAARAQVDRLFLAAAA